MNNIKWIKVNWGLDRCEQFVQGKCPKECNPYECNKYLTNHLKPLIRSLARHCRMVRTDDGKVVFLRKAKSEFDRMLAQRGYCHIYRNVYSGWEL